MGDCEKFEIVSRGIKNILIGIAAIITAWFGTDAIKSYTSILEQNLNNESSASSSAQSSNSQTVNCNQIIQHALSTNIKDQEKIQTIIKSIPDEQFWKTGANKEKNEILDQLKSKNTPMEKIDYLKTAMPQLNLQLNDNSNHE